MRVLIAVLWCVVLMAGEAELPEAARKALDGMRASLEKARSDYATRVKDENQRLVKILKAEQERQTKAGKLEQAMAVKDMVDRAQRGEYIEPLLNPSAGDLLDDVSDSERLAGLPRDLTKDLVLSISFEESKPTAVLKRGLRKLTVVGTWRAGQGIRGKGAIIDSGTYLTLDGTDLLPVGGAPRTLAAWFQTRQSPGYQTIAEYGSTEVGRRWFMLVSSTGGYAFGCHSRDLPFGGSGMTDERWHHFAYTYDGRTATAFVDGRAVGSSSFDIDTAASPLFLGRNSNQGHGGGDKMQDGLIDEVMVWSRALNAEEVASLYKTYAKP